MAVMLSLAQAAGMAGVSSVTFWRYLRQGTGPKTVRVGNRRLIRNEDMADWLAARFADIPRRPSTWTLPAGTKVRLEPTNLHRDSTPGPHLVVVLTSADHKTGPGAVSHLIADSLLSPSGRAIVARMLHSQGQVTLACLDQPTAFAVFLDLAAAAAATSAR